MLMVLSTILGFLGPFLPELLKWFNRRQDNAHELALLDKQAEIAKDAAAYRIQEVTLKGNLEAEAAELRAIHQPQMSFGVQLLDAAKGWSPWVVVPVFWAFAVLDWLNGSVRPMVTYWIVGFWIYYKYSLLSLAAETNDARTAVVANWTENDWAVLLMCLGYFFGQRIVKAAFGGSASTGRVGGG